MDMLIASNLIDSNLTNGRDNQHNHDRTERWIRCYLGLGSNLTTELGSPIEHIQQALTALGQHQQVRDLQVSSFYASSPMGPQDQPDFINVVAALETILEPLELLDACQQLETDAKRARLRHWGERSLDVDILLYGQAQINETRLKVPHAGIAERNFVLVPLRELALELIIAGKPIAAYSLSADWTDLKRLDSGIKPTDKPDYKFL